MNEVDLLSIGSYTELPGGNIALPSGYSGILAPILKVPVVHTLLYRYFISILMTCPLFMFLLQCCYFVWYQKLYFKRLKRLMLKDTVPVFNFIQKKVIT